ncbi:MAG: class A beta-lactamase-related serine hydrolase, partial [Dehalococcoidia bacterium]|nr:class A beta-lactamase-related serine hydrolase [Dehalococcoidia bacterium]
MIRDAFIARDPAEVGVDREALKRLFDAVRRDVGPLELHSAQVAVARHGRLAGAAVFGRAVQGGVLRVARPNTLYCLYSATKGITAISTWRLVEAGLLRPEQRVAEIIPEFGTNGKDVVTVQQVYTHSSGFPQAPFHPRLWGDREALLRRFGDWRLTSELGKAVEYHPTAAHWVLSEI